MFARMLNELKMLTLPDGTTIARRVPSGSSGGIKFLLATVGAILLVTAYWVVGLMLLALAAIIGKGHYECGACGHPVSARSHVCRICRVQLVRRIPAKLDPRLWIVRPLVLNACAACCVTALIFLVLWAKHWMKLK